MCATISLSTLCEKSLSSLSPFILGSEYQKKILLFANSFTAKWNTSQIGLECSLMKGEVWGDFHCLANVEEICRSAKFKDPSWVQMTDLFNTWIERDFLEKNNVARTILEFDVGSSSVWPPKPNICLLYKRDCFTPLDAISNILPSYLEKKYIINTVKSFLDKGWTIDGIGFMLARKDCLRVLFRTKSAIHLLIEFFAKLELYGVVNLLRDIFIVFPVQPFLFEIDINDKGVISPRIGIDIPAKSQFFSEKLIIEALCFENLISVDKKNALLSWAGVDDSIITNDCGSILRDIHHFKVVTSPDQEISVKAYLSSRYVKGVNLARSVNND